MNPALIVGLGIVAAAALVAGGAWLFHFFTIRAARKELEDYKGKVITLSDKIDALKERHKLLPYANKGFTVPMAGETLAAFTAVAEQLERHRAKWLKLMDVWEQAQALVDEEWLLGSRKARQARRRIQEAKVVGNLEAIKQECELPLQRIETAHEQVAAKRKTYEHAGEQLAVHERALAATSLSTNFYQSGAAAAQSLSDQSATALPADPLAALRLLDEALNRLGQLNESAARILEHAQLARDSAARIEQVTNLARQHRAQGLLLKEAAADPDVVLAEASRQHAAAWDLLNRADEPAARLALTKLATLIDEGQQRIERHLAARSRCEKEIPQRRGDVRRLAELQSAAHWQQAELERDFVAEAWQAVGTNAAHAQALLASAQQLIDQAAQHAEHNVQSYCQAAELVSQAAENQRQAEQSLTAVGRRLIELVELRRQCQSQIAQVRTLADNVAGLLRSSSADRIQANERFHAASGRLERLIQESRMPRPDWERLAASVREVETELQRAERMGREDMQLSRQAAAQIAEAENAIGQAAAFADLGCTPNLEAAREQLGQARARLAGQDYEAAAGLAAAAQRRAQEAWNQAKTQAEQRRERSELQRRTGEAARSAAASPAPESLSAEAEEPPLQKTQII